MPAEHSAQTFYTFFVCPCGFEAKYHQGGNSPKRIELIRRLHYKVCVAKQSPTAKPDPNHTITGKLSKKCADNQGQLHKEIQEFIQDAKVRGGKGN
jgi:hypothetical protein